MSRYISIFWDKVTLFMDNSVFFRFINYIMSFFGNLFGGSVIVKHAVVRTDEKNFETSYIHRFISFFPWMMYRARDLFFARAFESSGIVTGVKVLPGLCFSLKLRDIGIGILVIPLNYCLLSGGISLDVFTVGAFVAGILTVCAGMATPATVYDMIEGSLIYRLVSRYFDIVVPDGYKNKKYKRGYLFCIAVGLYVSIIAVKLPLICVVVDSLSPPLAALMTVYPYLGLLGIVLLAPLVVLVISYPYLGLLGIVFLAPFVPTMLLAGLLAFVGLCFVLKLLTDSGYEFKLDLMGVFVFLFIILNLWKGVFSFHRSSSIKIALLITLFMMVYFLIVSLTDTGRKLHVMMFAISLSAAVAGLYGLYQKLSGKVDMTWVDKEQAKDVTLRIVSTLGNPNVYGAYLLLAIPVCLIAAYISKKILLKLYYTGVSGLLILNLALTYSRGCYLALALGVVVFILFIEKRLVALMPAGLFLIPVVLPSSMINRIFSITNLSDSSTTYRISIWQATVRMLKDFWISGVGQGIDAYNVAYPLYGFNAVAAPHSHNLFLQVFVETGIFGLFIFLALLFCFYKTLAPFFRQTTDMKHRVFAAGMMGMLTGLMLQAFFDYIFYNYKVFFLFFAVFALCGAYVRLYGSGKDGTVRG